MKGSIIIRTYNEGRYLPELLHAVRRQNIALLKEVIVVDSGSTDDTVRIATDFGCRIIHIHKEDFSFGRSLNVGCQAATGDVLVFISGHCIPIESHWLEALLTPIAAGTVVWTYGRQVGNESSRFSERQLFAKHYPGTSQIPQKGFFCNNANSALLKTVWESYSFNEELTGLEDMHLAQRLVKEGMSLGYVAEAGVFHIHTETWSKVKTRFEREAVALQRIMPEVHISFWDFIRYVASSLLFDCGEALKQRSLVRNAGSIISYRTAQYWGSYRGNHLHRKLSRTVKERYFYPR